MRVMVIVKSNPSAEAGATPSERLLAEMGTYNEALVNAGVLLTGEGLHPSSEGVRVSFSGGQARVTNGPFPHPNELIAGFWLWQVDSIDDAIEWIKRMPSADKGAESEIEIRPVFEAEDFGAEFTPELRAQEEGLRARVQGRAAD
jgi:hypothetical protein